MEADGDDISLVRLARGTVEVRLALDYISVRRIWRIRAGILDVVLYRQDIDRSTENKL